MSRAAPSGEALRESFGRVEAAPRYRRWILDQVRPHLGRRLLEVGCGVGNFTAELLDLDRVVALDLEAAYVAELERRLGPHPALRTVVSSATRPELPARLAGEQLDCALALNVLEHVEDDVGALRTVARCLRPGSAVVVQVPAHPWLSGTMDRALGHLRRYGPGRLGRTLLAAGLSPERVWQWNLCGVPGWLLNGRLLGVPMFSAAQLRLYEAAVPLLRRLEPAGGTPLGLSLMAVARTAR